MSAAALRVARCEPEAARFACEHWHYSGRVPAGKTVRFGVWETGRFIGAVLYTSGSAGVRNIGPALGLDTVEVCELARVALRAHAAPVTQIIAETLRLLRQSCPGLRVVVSYADPEQGHTGGIYRAGNWFYVGRGAATMAYQDINGVDHHSRTLSASGFTRQMGIVKKSLRPVDMVAARKTAPKYKYLMPLDKRIRKRLLPLVVPFP